MPYDVRQWPQSVYPGEAQRECAEAIEVIDTLILNMRREGPRPTGYRVKTLGAAKVGLWQVNLKVHKRQVRILYAPYDGDKIVLFRVHRKGSPEEQERAYELAADRKRQYERDRELARRARNDGNRTLH